jgi:phosphoserine aminotransferase
MTERAFNFYSGPATLPAAVLEQARAEMLSFNGSGISVMEISHRSDEFLAVLRSAEDRLRALLAIPENYKVLFLQGGASLQFSMVPMNFLDGGSADYVVTGTWSEKAGARAADFGAVNVVYSTEPDGYSRIPLQDDLRFSPDAKYVHYVSNETIDGVEFPYDLDGFGIPVVCDASSNILSKPIEIEKYSLIYAGAQKNIGPSGVTVVIIRGEVLETSRDRQQGVLSYCSFADNGSMPNTPNTWGIYIIDLVCSWLQEQGGVSGVAAINEKKAELLYAAIDNSDGFYTGLAEPAARSRMNVTFRLPSEELEAAFCREAQTKGMIGLKGHRSVGGIRASIYNAFPIEGVERLVEHMKHFAERNM